MTATEARAAAEGGEPKQADDGSRLGAPARSDATPATDASPAAGTSAAAPIEDAAPMGAVQALPRLLKAGGAVVAPATLITALLLQFGRLWAAGYFRYFGVNFSVLDLTTNDFLTSGADGLWIPVAAASLTALVVIWLHRLLLSRLSEHARRRAFRVLIPVAGAIGAVLVGLALLDLVGHVRPIWDDASEAGGLSLALGTLLLVYAVRLVRLAPRWRRHHSGTTPPCAGRRPARGWPNGERRSSW